MIRGALEVANQVEVSGWLYSSQLDLRGTVVLAFSGGRCLGAGSIEVFREDLLAAQLGDGMHGFRFPIDGRGVDPGSIVVRLEGSDLTLLQPYSVVARVNDTVGGS
jgi:hypothetical protein